MLAHVSRRPKPWLIYNVRLKARYMYRHYTFEPDLDSLARLIDGEVVPRGYELSLNRVRRDRKFARGLIKGDRLRRELSELETLDIDFYYAPGNEHIGGHGAVDLDFTEKSATLKCSGDWNWFADIFERWIRNLLASPTQAQLLTDLIDRLRASLAQDLFAYVEPSLKAGKYTAALSAAVVFVEDRLRSKLGAAGVGLTGAELALYAFKNPGKLRPPLAHATNADENAFILFKGWFGLVRNLHGHQVSFSMSHDEVFAQLSGCSYIVWLIDNSVIK